jgi:hypothetical protein
VRCPSCGYIMRYLPIRVCPNLIARMRTREITSLSRKLARQERDRLDSFFETSRAIENLPEGEVFTTQQFLKKLGWFSKSKGDLTRVFLDWNVCRGLLRKLEFNKTRRGHVYIKEEGEPCQMLKTVAGSSEYDTCEFSFKDEDGAVEILQFYRR